jgi:pimeloyl-ACP methyl ester carboxylesterase
MRRPFLSWLADRLILCPTRHPIDAGGKTRRMVSFGGDTPNGALEIWTQRVEAEPSAAADLYVLKFPGTAGRAERSTGHPADAWPGTSVELWTLNPPGYGGSAGTASLRGMAAVADTVLETLREQAAGRPILVSGNSLGCVSALYLAARHGSVGLILRNPPPLREVIVERFGRRWWSFGVRLLAHQIAPELDAIRNAAATSVPAVFITAQRDRIVPPRCQQQVIDAFGGPKRVLRLAQADHHTLMTEAEAESYRDDLQWLHRQIMPGQGGS